MTVEKLPVAVGFTFNDGTGVDLVSLLPVCWERVGAESVVKELIVAGATEIVVFKPNSRQKDITIRNLIPRNAISTLRERLDQEAGDKAEKALRNLDRVDGDFTQFRHGDRRVRVYTGV